MYVPKLNDNLSREDSELQRFATKSRCTRSIDDNYKTLAIY